MQVRPYRKGEETGFIELFRRSYGGYGGHVERSVPYWRWSILDRPGLSPEDILVAEEGSRLLGYGVLGPTGWVLEFAVEPELGSARRGRVAERLASSLEALARSKQLETLVFQLPRGDRELVGILRRSGYLEEPTGSLQLVIVDLISLLQDLVARPPDGPSCPGETMLLELEPGGYNFLSHDRVLLGLSPPRAAAAGADTKADVVVRTDASNLTDMIFRRKTLDEIEAAGELTTDPPDLRDAAARILTALIVRTPWYTPPADAR